MDLGDRYRTMLLNLLPPGRAWPKHEGSGWFQLMDGLSQELIRVHLRALQLLEERDPRTTNELLSDWERVMGLPDDCAPAALSTQERRNQVVGKLVGRGGQNKAYFIRLAASLGFTITITEFRPFRAGHSRCGDPLSGGNWTFVWRVNAPAQTIVPFLAGKSCAGDPLRKWGNALLECTINRRKPSHTKVYFAYGP